MSTYYRWSEARRWRGRLPWAYRPFVPPTTEGPWHVAFADAFPGKVANKAHWNTCYPWGTPAGCTNFGNSELQWYLHSQVQVSENTLHLVAREQATADKTATGSPMTYGWRSGMVTSYKKFSFTYGYVQGARRSSGTRATGWRPGCTPRRARPSQRSTSKSLGAAEKGRCRRGHTSGRTPRP